MGKFYKIELNINEKDYLKIKKFIDAYNNYEEIKKNFSLKGKVEDFILGSIKREIERIENHDEVFCELKSRGYIRPIKLKNNFKDILKGMGLKQLDLEEMTGIGGSDISGYLNNRRIYSIDHFLRIWICLGCPELNKIFYVGDKQK